MTNVERTFVPDGESLSNQEKQIPPGCFELRISWGDSATATIVTRAKQVTKGTSSREPGQKLLEITADSLAMVDKVSIEELENWRDYPDDLTRREIISVDVFGRRIALVREEVLRTSAQGNVSFYGPYLIRNENE